jgi:hypothetical protein
LLRLPFDPKGGGRIFPQNDGTLLPLLVWLTITKAYTCVHHNLTIKTVTLHTSIFTDGVIILL